MDITPIGLTNDTMCNSQIHDVNVVRKFYTNLLSPTNREYVSPGTELKKKNVAYSGIFFYS